jgi:hypothetical protein
MLRRTCQRWNSLLSSTQLMRNALSRFTTHHPADSALDTQADANPSLVLELRHILALRLALPFTYVSFPGNASSLDLRHLKITPIQLKGRFLAQLRRDHSRQWESVVVWDLVSGDSGTFRGQARESLLEFALSTGIIAYVTFTGILYVASLGELTASPTPVRLPSSSVFAMAANGDTVAMLLANGHEPVVMIYNAGTRKSNSFNLEAARTAAQEKDPGMVWKVRTVAVNEGRGTIDFGAISFPGNGTEGKPSGLRVLVFRFSLAGEYLMHTAWDQNAHGLSRSRGPDATLGPLQATGERGLLSMEVVYHYDHYDDPPDAVLVPASLTLLYDEDDMSLKAVDWMVSRSKSVPRPVLWKDRLYRITSQVGPIPAFHAHSRSETGFDELDVGPNALTRLKDQSTDPPALGIHTDWRIKPISEHSRLWPRDVRMQPQLDFEGIDDFLVMNDSFLVTVSAHEYPAKIKVFCLDERVKLHGAECTLLWEREANPSLYWDNEIKYNLPSSV